MALTDTPVTSDSGSATGTTTMSLTTTNAFSPGAGSMVLVRLSWLFANSGTATTITVQDSHGNGYTSQLQAANSFQVAGSAVFYFVYSTAPGSTTLTVTSSASSATSGGTQFLISPSIVTGQASGTLFGPNTINIAPSGSTTNLSASLTTTVSGSEVYLAGGIESGSTLTAVAGTTTTATFTGTNNAITGLATSHTGTPGATTFGFTASPAAAFGGNLIGVELLPATGTARTATAALTVTVGRSAARTRGQVATAAQTVTVGRSAAATGSGASRTATAALTVTVGRSAAPNTAHVRSAALTVAVGRSAATSGGHHPATASPAQGDYDSPFRWKMWL